MRMKFVYRCYGKAVKVDVGQPTEWSPLRCPTWQSSRHPAERTFHLALNRRVCAWGGSLVTARDELKTCGWVEAPF